MGEVFRVVRWLSPRLRSFGFAGSRSSCFPSRAPTLSRSRGTSAWCLEWEGPIGGLGSEDNENIDPESLGHLSNHSERMSLVAWRLQPADLLLGCANPPGQVLLAEPRLCPTGGQLEGEVPFLAGPFEAGAEVRIAKLFLEISVEICLTHRDAFRSNPSSALWPSSGQPREYSGLWCGSHERR